MSLNCGFDCQRSLIRIQDGSGAYWDGDSIWAVAKRQTAQDGHAERKEAVAQNINDRPALGFVKSNKLADGNPAYAIQEAGFQQPGEMPIDMAEACLDILDQQDSARQTGQNPACGCRDHVEVTAQENAVGPPVTGKGCRNLVWFRAYGDRLGQGVVIGIADAADGRLDAGFGEALGVPNGDILGGFKRSSQQPDAGGCDEDTEAAIGSIRAGSSAVTWPAPLSTA